MAARATPTLSLIALAVFVGAAIGALAASGTDVREPPQHGSRALKSWSDGSAATTLQLGELSVRCAPVAELL